MSDKNRKRERSDERFRLFQYEVLFVFAMLIIIVTAFLDYIILDRTGQAMQEKVSDLIAANSRQLELNINSYLERMETTPTLLFSDEVYYLYDETDGKIEDYDKVKSEETIKNRIVDIGLMDNYSDFGIVFADDHKVGWVSHGTQDLFKDGGIYDTFSSYITNPKKNDGWCFGVNGNSDRMYYIKRLNPNAILISSIYTRELASVFVYPEQLEEMTIRLVDENNTIMYSSDNSEIGDKLPVDILENIEGEFFDAGNSSSIVTRDYLINTNVCFNGWRVVCSVPTDIILKENQELKSFTLRISGALAMMFVLVGLIIITKLSKPMDGMVSSLQDKAEIDRLSGVMNKAAFQENVENELKKEPADDLVVFVMMDMDNFKQINDRLGHSYGDQVIIRMGKLLRKLYNSQTIIGRLGGDEFALYTGCRDVSMEDIKAAAIERMEQVISSFTEEFEYEREQCELSISAGVYIKEVADTKFEDLYEKADSALYISKKNGKSCYTFYGEEAETDEK
ncbi:MAG: GGDEF domain-containing protein [Lachnospiraceae bacterium]|nr:GGDEF domain-containing protein [Lachnospiraceae bacterium]